MKNLLGTIIGLAILGIMVSALMTLTSEQMDLRDGGNAQVIKVEAPADGWDQDSANVYRTLAQGNKANQEGDAVTTIANAQARNIDVSTWLGTIVVVMFLGLGAVALIRAAQGQ